MDTLRIKHHSIPVLHTHKTTVELGNYAQRAALSLRPESDMLKYNMISMAGINKSADHARFVAWQTVRKEVRWM